MNFKQASYTNCIVCISIKLRFIIFIGMASTGFLFMGYNAIFIKIKIQIRSM